MLTNGKVLEEWKREKALRASVNKGQVLPLVLNAHQGDRLLSFSMIRKRLAAWIQAYRCLANALARTAWREPRGGLLCGARGGDDPTWQASTVLETGL
ncbi:hypothetical protein [Paucibacter sp. DJ2R-2]|uniref:hypothetical protein n=1 Tax=Paucibacter sp. DJ2R-2 TaxID=2893558 RepID=UPI0021E3F9A7|nr:hypothetical protein [Paucibacter sp. DJ2R-2]MCV2421137.1 hypothetical protein [Paucibacter sp. DJ4R-1]MCV2439115.1 hypothetical protein [Paucibacter sp. DJ2R-2]